MGDFVATKLMTRQTYTLDGISGTFSDAGGKLKLTEEDGIDYAPTTVQTPGGERVPFLFTVKDLVATGAKPGTALQPGFEFGGSFKVPSYRTGLFLDPKDAVWLPVTTWLWHFRVCSRALTATMKCLTKTTKFLTCS